MSLQAPGAGVLRALRGRGRRGRAARVPVAGAQDGALRARAAAARAVRAARRRAAHAPRRAGAGRAGTASTASAPTHCLRPTVLATHTQFVRPGRVLGTAAAAALPAQPLYTPARGNVPMV